MIPHKLELKNFLCYGEKVQEVNFKEYSLICLSGKNGNGKSALLDAMTWALWGQARKVTGAIKADEGLLRLGQTRMMVSFEFELGEKTYRVRREYAKTYGKPYAAVDFEVFNESTSRFVSLTDKTIRATQQKIEKTLALDFDTFINSAFLKQGHSNEFSKKTPKERKIILANILGLSKYDRLQQLALEHVKKNTEEKKVTVRLIEQNNEELCKKNDVTKNLEHQQEALKKNSKELDAISKKQSLFEKERSTLEEKKRQDTFLKKQLDNQKKVINEKYQAVLKTVATWKNIHYKSLNLPNIKHLDEEQKALRSQEKVFIEHKQKILKIQESILNKKELLQKKLLSLKRNQEKELGSCKLDLEKQKLTLKHHAQNIHKREISINSDRKSIKDLEQDIQNIEKKLNERETFEKHLETINQQFEKRKIFYQTLVQKGNHTKGILKDLEQKKHVTQDKKNPACPLCEQVLTLKRKQFLACQLGKQESFHQHRLSRISKLLPAVKNLLLEQHKIIQTLSKKHDAFTQQKVQLEAFTKQHTQLCQNVKTENAQLKELKKQHLETEKLIQEQKKLLAEKEKEFKQREEHDSELVKIKAALNKLVQQKDSIAFDAKTYSEIQKKLKRIENEYKKAQTIKQEREQQPSRKLTISQLCKELKKEKKSVEELETERKKITFNASEEADLITKINDLQKQQNHFVKTKETILQDIGKLINELSRLEKLKSIQKNYKTTLNKIHDEIEDYQILAHTFSKNGIQALLIEEAVPEIEEEANNILSKLTNNQAQIFIESLRDLKSGGVKETLDIKITDAAGIRPYEMYSGGEAFRIDFALRIAISKLLARRVGTSLQTLIIDEGFGSQDEEGLARLMSAIHAIHKDFSKVIIVSHLPQFKDNFPIHFLVEKGPSGSTIRIEERG